MIYLENYVNGKLVAPAARQYLDNYEPAIGKVYSQIPDSDEIDVNEAVKAAWQAFPAWSNTAAEERSKYLWRIAELIEARMDELVTMEAIDNGKTISLAGRLDIPRAASNFRFFANAATQFASESHITESHAVNYTLRQPLGVVCCISPWNLPLYLFTWKIAPALAAGNCVVAKPSEITPMTAYELSKICIEAGLPPGVLNILHGTGPKCGFSIVKHPNVKGISFTGSTRAGREIASATAPLFKKVSLELGGKNPNLIFADCDFNQMIKDTMRSSFWNQGEICLCGSRILVEKPIYEKFKEAFIAETKKLKVGDPLDAKSDMGAIVSKQHFDKIMYYIQLAKEEGGKILLGGNAVQMDGRCADGWFIEPTIIDGLPMNCRTNQEEIFGPVVTITPFENEEEAVSLANNSDYGLACSIWTSNLSRAHRVAAQLQIGIIWINCWLFRDLRTPFGGMKNSGAGREGGNEAMRFFTEPKNVCIKLD